MARAGMPDLRARRTAAPLRGCALSAIFCSASKCGELRRGYGTKVAQPNATERLAVGLPCTALQVLEHSVIRVGVVSLS